MKLKWGEIVFFAVMAIFMAVGVAFLVISFSGPGVEMTLPKINQGQP